MKPYRVRLTHDLITTLSIDKKLTRLPPSRLTTSEMSKFHSDEYGVVQSTCKTRPRGSFQQRADSRSVPSQVYRVLEEHRSG
jgi:acetoin utilization deacetylase AcuC-like enzyme